MRPEDLLEDQVSTDFGLETTTRRFRRELARTIRQGPIPGESDIEIAIALARVVYDELEAFGTHGGNDLNDEDMREALPAFRCSLERIGVPPIEFPFRDLTTFRSFWLRNGASGSWQARRDIIDELFGDLHDRLIQLETASLRASLADGVTPRGRTGWSTVDLELDELRRHFRAAQTPQDYRNIGNDCVNITEALSRLAYDAEKHLRPGETEPPVAKTKQRLERFVEDAAPGPDNEAVRKLARAAIEMAQAIKHRSSPTRRDAGIAADAVTLLAHILRRLDEPE